MAKTEWFRPTTWDRKVQADFEQRLKRARPEGRPQHLRVAAVTLADTGDPHFRAAARELLLRLIDECPHDFQVPSAHELLGRYYRLDGQFEEAE